MRKYIAFALFISFFSSFYSSSACSCFTIDSDYFSNLGRYYGSTDEVHVLAVFDGYVEFDTMQYQKKGRFLLLDTIGDQKKEIPDTFYLTLGSGSLCEESFTVFDQNDTTFLSFSVYQGLDDIVLVGLCSRNYLKIENGHYQGLSLEEVSEQMRLILAGRKSKTRCLSPQGDSYDFFKNVTKGDLIVKAKFKGAEYNYNYDGLATQTAHFEILKEYRDFKYQLGDSIVVLGASGLNSGYDFFSLREDSTFYLILNFVDFAPVGSDTFMLKESHCGDYLAYSGTLQQQETLETKIESIVLGTAKMEDVAVEIYPTYAEDFIKINSPQYKIDQIEILNPLGEVVSQFSGFDSKDFQISTSNLSSGLYFIRLTSGDQQITKRILKQ